MKFKMPKIKILKVLLSSKLLYGLIIILVIAILSVLIFFLYKNFYQTITQSEQIILLKKEVAPDTIDMKRVGQVLDLLDKKTTTTEAIIYSEIKNPFDITVAETLETLEIN